MSEKSSNSEIMEKDLQYKQRSTSNLNLRHNDNAFHVLASLLVEFFQARLVVEEDGENDKKIINISSEDKTALKRLLPKTAMWDFIDAVSYRLEITPVVPTTPIHLLTVRCQELCLDKEEIMENPILATYEITTSDTVTINVVALVLDNRRAVELTGLDDDSGSDGAVDYRGALQQSSEKSDDSDGFVHTNIESNSSDLSSSDGSGIKVASSKDIADEMKRHEEQGIMACTDNRNRATPTVLSDNDSMPTEYDDDDFEEFLQNDNVDPIDVPLHHGEVEQHEGEDIGSNVTENLADEDIENNDIDKSLESKPLADVTNIVIVSNYAIENLNSDEDEKHENDEDAVETFAVEIEGLGEEEGEEIEVLPTLTGTFDDETKYTTREIQDTIDNQDDRKDESSTINCVSNVDPSYYEANDTEIGEEIYVLPTETVDDTTIPTIDGKDTSAVVQSDNNVVGKDETNKNKVDVAGAAPIVEVTQAQPEKILHKDHDESMNENSKDINKAPPQNATNNITIENVQEIDTTESDVITTDVQQIEELIDIDNIGSLTTEDKTTVDENVAIRMQDVAGAFFSDLRYAIDEKVEAFEYALVNAIVSKPLQVPKREYQKGPQSEVNRQPIKQVIDKTTQNQCKKLEHEKIVGSSLSNANIGKQSYAQNESTTKEITHNDADSSEQPFEKNFNEKRKEQVSPTSFSVQSGFTSLFAGLAAGFAPSEKGNETKSIQSKSIISSFPSDESRKEGTQYSVIDYSFYEAMEVTDSAARHQLILELKEACTLMKQSITPETTRFWSDHIQSLKKRLDSLERKNNKNLDPRLERQDVPNDDQESYNVHQETIPTVESDMQSNAVLSEIQSTKGIPVVPALSQFSSYVPVNAQYGREYQVHSIPHTNFPTSAPHSANNFVESEVNLPHYGHPEIELSESRGRFIPNPSDELYTQPHDSNTHQTVDNEDEGYYEYPLVDVVAPADLPGGYHFEAEIEGQRFLATVPPEGVQQGETFTCYMKELDSVAIDIPVGAWKDGLFNMCELGWYHPVLWNALFCPLIALGQIQTRVNLDFLGRPKFGDLPYTNRFMITLVIASWAGMNTALFAASNFKWSRGLELSVADGCAFALVNVAMFGFIVFVTQSTRSSVREKFMIREKCCYDLEDVCCAALCLPCTVGQMQRHTANYDDYEAVCCSKTGLPNGVRVNQEPAKVKETPLENEDGYIV